MSINQYEWLLSIAKMWRNTKEGDREKVPGMDRIDGVLGKLTPTGQLPANETTFMRALMASGGEFLISNSQSSAIKFNFLCKLFAFFDQNSSEKCKTRPTAFFPANLDFMRVSGLFDYLGLSSIPGTAPQVGLAQLCATG